MPRAISLIAALALLILAAACGNTDTPTPTWPGTVWDTSTPTPTPTSTVKPPLPPNGLEKALEGVPVEYKDKRLIFDDYGRARSLIGADDTSLISNLGWQELNDSFQEQEGRHSPYVGMWHITSFFMVFLTFYKEFGLEESLWPGALSGVAIWHDISGPDRPMFLSVGATFPTDPVIEKLLESGSEEADYQGVTYYSRNEDYLGSPRDPLTKGRAILNRVAFIEDRFLAA